MAQEKIFDVIWSGERQKNTRGTLPAVGDNTNLRTGKTANIIGANQLAAMWIDPEFDPSQSAVFYVRVLQSPPLRHSQLDAIALGLATPFEGPAIIEERAYTSPVWYTPNITRVR